MIKSILAYIEIAFTLLLLIPITFLLAMHIYFRFKGITTYEYISIKRKNSEKPSAEKLDEKLKDNTTNVTNV